MPADCTVPSRTLRRLGREAGPLVVSSTIRALLLFRLGDLALAQDGLQTSDVLAHGAQTRVVVELPGHVLEAEVEQLLLSGGQVVEQLLLVHLTQLGGARHQISSDRVTNFALMGSFWMARLSASLASVSLTPASSNMIRPGFTTATQRSGLPLPEPMRVSAGFSVTGLSGKMLIQTLPPRLMWRVMAIRAASIWRAVIHPGSSAWMP